MYAVVEPKTQMDSGDNHIVITKIASWLCVCGLL